MRENEIDNSAEHAPRRRDNAKDRQSTWDVFGLEPEPCANGGGQSEEREADVVIIETSGELDARERLKAIWFENFQITYVAEKPKRRQTIERRNKPQDRKD